MRGVLIILLIAYGCFGCSNTEGINKFKYMEPQHVQCYGRDHKICTQYGSKMLCECVA